MTTNLDQERVERAAEASYHSRSRNKPYRLLSMFQRDRLVADARAAITAYLGDTHVVVPREPTERMIEAGCDNNPTQWNEGTDLGFAADVANEVYRAMLSATPTSNGKEG